MILRALKFIRLPIVLLVLWTILRFLNGTVFGVPYAPRGNAMFSIVGLTFITAIIYGALSKRVGSFGWLGTIAIGVMLALIGQVLIFGATALSYAIGKEATSYFTHWDALNIPEGETLSMGAALAKRAGAFLVAPIITAIAACIGRLLAFLAPNGRAPQA